MKSSVSLSVVLVCLVFTIACYSYSLAASAERPDARDSKSRAVQSWEHLRLTQEVNVAGTDAETSKKIMELGDAGWELVDVANVSREGSTVTTNYYFKRPK